MADKKSLALSIVNTLTANGYQALFAGGCVRDMLLKIEPGDIDIATNATPQTIAKLFKQTVNVGEHFGVMVVILDTVSFEVATFRSDQGIADGRHPGHVVFTDAEHDALRRDFTINGMFYDPVADKVFDYVGGKRDLERRVIRSIGDPSLRFAEDYLRMLRAIRFSARFGFAIDEATMRAIAATASAIEKISAERIFAELDKMLLGPDPAGAIGLLDQSALLTFVLPEIAALKGVEQPPQFHPEGDVFKHTLLTLSHLGAATQVLAWSALLHDIGKPATQSSSDRIRFNNHNRVGADMAQMVLRRLRAPNNLIEAVTACIDNHMNFMNVENMRMSTLKRFLARPTLDDELALHRADCLASHGDLGNIDFLLKKRGELKVDEIRPVALLSGRDLIALGFKPGPLFGDILRQVYDLQLENTLPTHDQAVEFVKATFKP